MAEVARPAAAGLVGPQRLPLALSLVALLLGVALLVALQGWRHGAVLAIGAL